MTFKTFFENTTLGLTEVIEIEGVGKLNAKVDSGNSAYNVLHGTDIEDMVETVSFRTVSNRSVTKRIVERIDINIGSSNIENRPVVMFNIKVNGSIYRDVKFSIADRTDNIEKVLLGKDFIEELGGLIDVRKE